MKTELKIPTLSELVSESENDLKQNALMVILNQEPPKEWVELHKFIKIEDENGNKKPLPYLPISRVEYLLTRIYGRWWVEIKEVKAIANSVNVVIRLYVKNPISGEIEWQDGTGASPIQTEQGAGAMDWNKAKSAGVQMASPAAESYALKDAAEKFGKIFGRDLSRKGKISYDSLLKANSINIDDLRELLDLKRDALSVSELKEADRIINNNEVNSFSKLLKLLQSK